MHNPTENLKLPITEWEQSLAFDTAVECETFIATRWVKAEKENRELNLSGTGVYPPMLFIRLCRPKIESAMTREEIERKMDELAHEICG
jgi:hypothetical protein